jgi:hypothetical protein
MSTPLLSSRFFRAETYKFTKADDLRLRSLVRELGTQDWALVARRMGGGRTTRQCRERWQNYLRPDIKNGPWTKEEEDLLVQKHAEFGPLWRTLRQFFPNRTDIDIKNCWLRRQRKLRLTVPQADLALPVVAAIVQSESEDEWDDYEVADYP